MVDKNNTEKLKSRCIEYKYKNKDIKDTVVKTIQFFISFDLVNFTAFKIENPNNWYLEYKVIVESIIMQFQKKELSLKLWKTLGDELIFRKKIKEKEELVTYIEGSFDVLHKIAKQVERKSNKRSSVKATSWVCFVNDDLNYKTEHTKGDYIGPHMDQGFRIAHSFARRRQLALSAELAYLLSKINENLQYYFHIVGYEKLKGIWDGNYYPIIWFSNNENLSKDYLPYDEEARCKYIRHFINNIQKGKNGKRLLEDETFVHALKDNKKDPLLNEILQLLK